MTSSMDKKIVMAEEMKLKEAYQQWRSTGILTNDKTIVKALFYKFQTIASASALIPEYKLMANDAIQNASRLRDIIVARYGKEEAQNL